MFGLQIQQPERCDFLVPEQAPKATMLPVMTIGILPGRDGSKPLVSLVFLTSVLGPSKNNLSLSCEMTPDAAREFAKQLYGAVVDAFGDGS